MVIMFQAHFIYSDSWHVVLGTAHWTSLGYFSRTSEVREKDLPYLSMNRCTQIVSILLPNQKELMEDCLGAEE